MQTDCRDWEKLGLELEAWGRLGRTAELWWRDDDADRPAEHLDRLLRLSTIHAAPVAIAVSPALASPALGAYLTQTYPCLVLQHGFAHANHAPPGQKKCELGGDRPLQAVVTEVRKGFGNMQQMFSDCFVPVMVPPWNRISDLLVTCLQDIGFIGISTYLERGRQREHGLVRCNTHVDIVNWKAGDRFVGTDRAIQLLVDHLAARRIGAADPAEPTGLLTHHQRHDEDAWRFIERFLEFTTRHPVVRWCSAAEIFGRKRYTDQV